MSAIVRAALLIVCIALHAGAEGRSLAIYAGQASGLHPSAIRSAQQELQRLLTPAGIDMLWKDLETRKNGEPFDQVVVMSFDGSCSEAVALAAPKATQETISLGHSSVSDGHVLPFVRVDCGYLAQMLASSLRGLSDKEWNTAFGRALGRVVAHEIYHIMGETTGHQDKGVAKASFSVRDLTSDNFDFDNSSLVQMRPPTPSFSFSDSEEEILER